MLSCCFVSLFVSILFSDSCQFVCFHLKLIYIIIMKSGEICSPHLSPAPIPHHTQIALSKSLNSSLTHSCTRASGVWCAKAFFVGSFIGSGTLEIAHSAFVQIASIGFYKIMN